MIFMECYNSLDMNHQFKQPVFLIRRNKYYVVRLFYFKLSL